MECSLESRSYFAAGCAAAFMDMLDHEDGSARFMGRDQHGKEADGSLFPRVALILAAGGVAALMVMVNHGYGTARFMGMRSGWKVADGSRLPRANGSSWCKWDGKRWQSKSASRPRGADGSFL